MENTNTLDFIGTYIIPTATAVNTEIVAVRKENEELKASVDRLCTENAQLKDEIRQLKEKLQK